MSLPSKDDKKAKAQGRDTLISIPYIASTDSKDWHKGDDKVQKLGDQVLCEVMRKSLADATQTELFPDVQPHPVQLRGEASLILAEHQDFIHLAAVNMMCYAIRTLPDIDPVVRDSIRDKAAAFFQMASGPISSSLIKGPDGKPFSIPHPVEEYGWSPGGDQAKIEKMQRSFLISIITCYEEAVSAAAPEIVPFLAEPAYWLDVLADYMEGDVFFERWKATLANPGAEVDAKRELLFNLRTLTVLKHRAKSDRDIQPIFTKLSKEAGLTYAVGETTDSELKLHLSEFASVVGSLDVWKLPTKVLLHPRFEMAQLKIVLPAEPEAPGPSIPIMTGTPFSGVVSILGGPKKIIQAYVSGVSGGLVQLVDDNDPAAFSIPERICRFLEREAAPLDLYTGDANWLHTHMIRLGK